MIELEHLTEEQKKQVLEIFPKEIPDIEKESEIKSEPEKELKNPPTPEQKEDWKLGYTEYDHKNKTSDRVVFEESEIEITEEDLE